MVSLNPFLDLDDEDNESLDGVLPLDAPAVQERQEDMLVDLTDQETEVMAINSLESPQIAAPENLAQPSVEIPAPQLVEEPVNEDIVLPSLPDIPGQATSVDLFEGDLGGLEEQIELDSAPIKLESPKAAPTQPLGSGLAAPVTAVENAPVLREDMAADQEQSLGARLDRLERNIVEEAYMPIPIEHGPLREGPGVG